MNDIKGDQMGGFIIFGVLVPSMIGMFVIYFSQFKWIQKIAEKVF